MFLAALTLFRRYFDEESRLGTFLSQQSYAVYIIHVPIVVFIGVALKGIQLGPFLKFGIASVITVPACFILAYILRKIPGVLKVV
jgi:peptidoglycan/LPS O-acetylase OafA/YrhL